MANDYIEEKANGGKYEPIEPQIKKWPIAEVYQDREELVETVIEETMNAILKGADAEKLQAEIARAYFSEMQRIRRTPWKADKPDEKDFWESLKRDTNNFELSASEEEKLEKYKEVIEIIVRRYTEEIAVTFTPSMYHFSKYFLSFGFASLLNAFQAKNIKAIFDHRVFIQDRIKISGPIDHIRELAKKGTVILLPTHFSNLDSIIVGWSIHAIGLPAFIYGAGLNLYNSKIVGFFMKRLGAYKVDRRKKNPFYLTTLKLFSKVSIEKGCHSLFFPGGTRSRSGEIDQKLKLGLLGTAFDAQYEHVLKGKENNEEPKKIFVVPMVMSYHFVLEAKHLIRQFLKTENKERYYFNRDDFSTQSKVARFILQLLRKKSDIYLSYGKPTDLFGNEVNQNGDSIINDKTIDISGYFESNGVLCKNEQREGVYTKALSDLVAKNYLKYNIVLTSHVVAFVVYRLLLNKFNSTDIYDLVEIDKNEFYLSKEVVTQSLEKVVNRLYELEQQGELICSEDVKKTPEEILLDGIKHVGIFHNNKPLTISNNRISSNDLELLFYYHNRMNGYDLEQYV